VDDEKNGKTLDTDEAPKYRWFPWITLVFALLRGIQVFSPAPAFALVTIWDLVALLLAGIYLALLKVEQYKTTIILLNFISWFVLVLPSLIFLPFAVFAPTYTGDSIWFVFILLVFFLISVNWLEQRKGKDKIKAIHLRLPPFLRRIAPEVYLGLLTICFIVLAFFTPRLMINGMTNSITYQYDGPQDIVTSYLQLEFNSYFPEIPGIVVSTCTGFAAFDLAPNYLGTTERTLYEHEILSSAFKARTNMEITTYTTVSFNASADISEFYFNRYEYAYSSLWKNGLYFLDSLHYDWMTTNLGNLTLVGEQVNVVMEYVRMDNTVGSDMHFWQYVAFLASNETILIILSGHRVSCYD
jgi:hypothetical protein